MKLSLALRYLKTVLECLHCSLLESSLIVCGEDWGRTEDNTGAIVFFIDKLDMLTLLVIKVPSED